MFILLLSFGHYLFLHVVIQLCYDSICAQGKSLNLLVHFSCMVGMIIAGNVVEPTNVFIFSYIIDNKQENDYNSND